MVVVTTLALNTEMFCNAPTTIKTASLHLLHLAIYCRFSSSFSVVPFPHEETLRQLNFDLFFLRNCFWHHISTKMDVTKY